MFRNIIWIGMCLLPILSFGQYDSDKIELEKAKALVDVLDLSTTQSKSFLSIIKEHGKKSVNALQTHENDLANLRKAMKSIQQNQDVEMEQLLTESQYATYLVEIKKDRVARRREFIKQNKAKRTVDE